MLNMFEFSEIEQRMKYRQKMEIFDRISGKYGEFLKAVLWKLTGDRELFSEAMQNAQLAIWRNVEKLDGKDCGSYLYRVAQSAASRAWRHRLGGNGEIAVEQVGVTADPAKKVTDDDTMRLVRRKIAELPPKQDRAIMMRYLEVKDYQRIAAELQCSPESARSNVSKALALLKRKLTDG